jgi:hypothetical protein
MSVNILRQLTTRSGRAGGATPRIDYSTSGFSAGDATLFASHDQSGVPDDAALSMLGSLKPSLGSDLIEQRGSIAPSNVPYFSGGRYHHPFGHLTIDPRKEPTDPYSLGMLTPITCSIIVSQTPLITAFFPHFCTSAPLLFRTSHGVCHLEHSIPDRMPCCEVCRSCTPFADPSAQGRGKTRKEARPRYRQRSHTVYDVFPDDF